MRGQVSMPNLTDYIEEYLKRLLALSTNGYIEIKRRELAGKFSCVPSQVNYVLERRFSVERGYLVESKRGGGGCIRIYRIDSDQIKTWHELVGSMKEEVFEAKKVRQLLERMCEEKKLSRRECCILEAIIREEIYSASGLCKSTTCKLQRRLFSVALGELLKTGY